MRETQQFLPQHFVTSCNKKNRQEEKILDLISEMNEDVKSHGVGTSPTNPLRTKDLTLTKNLQL